LASHYHVAYGLAGYGPDGADGFACFDEVGAALEYARDELARDVDMAHEDAHALADDGQYEDAWRAIVRMEDLEVLRANLDPARRQAPLYRDAAAAYAQLQTDQAGAFPHDVSETSRLYLWECDVDGCEHCEEDR
jgi:hypothetical protein